MVWKTLQHCLLHLTIGTHGSSVIVASVGHGPYMEQVGGGSTAQSAGGGGGTCMR